MATQETKCMLCQQGRSVENICGKLWVVQNPLTNCVAHQKCMQYSSKLVQYKFPSFGGFDIEEVEKEIIRGSKFKCTICKKYGATTGCALKECKKSFHFFCANNKSEVITERIEKLEKTDNDAEGETVVTFRVFCCLKHKMSCTDANEKLTEDSQNGNRSLSKEIGEQISSEMSDDESDSSSHSASLLKSTPTPPKTSNVANRKILTETSRANGRYCSMKSPARNLVDSLLAGSSDTPSPSRKKILLIQENCDSENDFDLSSSMKKRKIDMVEKDLETMLSENEFETGRSSKPCSKKSTGDKAVHGSDSGNDSGNRPAISKTRAKKVKRAIFPDGLNTDLERDCVPLCSSRSDIVDNSTGSPEKTGNELDVDGDHFKKKETEDVNGKNNSLIEEEKKSSSASLKSSSKIFSENEWLSKSMLTNSKMWAERLVRKAKKIQSGKKFRSVQGIGRSDADVGTVKEGNGSARPQNIAPIQRSVSEIDFASSDSSTSPLVFEEIEVKSNNDSATDDQLDFSSASSSDFDDLCEATEFVDLPKMEQVLAVCIPITDDLDDESYSILLKYALNKLGLDDENIYLWSYANKLSRAQMLSFVEDVSTSLRNQNESEWVQKLLKTGPTDVEDIVPPSGDSNKTIIARIQKNFDDAEKRYGVPVGRLCWISLLDLHVAFILLRDSNDPSKNARYQLPDRRQVYRCNADTLHTLKNSSPKKAAIINKEFQNLRWWLEEMIPRGTILCYPSERLLFGNSVDSVTNCLGKHFTHQMNSGGDSYLVFVRRTAFDLLHYGHFICKLLVYIKEELLTSRHDVYVIFDIGEEVGLVRVDELLMNFDRNEVETLIYSGANPRYSQISCLALHMILK